MWRGNGCGLEQSCKGKEQFWKRWRGAGYDRCGEEGERVMTGVEGENKG